MTALQAMFSCFYCGAHKASAQQQPVGLRATLHATPLVDLHSNDAVSMRRRKESEHEVRPPCACLCLCSRIAPAHTSFCTCMQAARECIAARLAQYFAAHATACLRKSDRCAGQTLQLVLLPYLPMQPWVAEALAQPWITPVAS